MVKISGLELLLFFTRRVQSSVKLDGKQAVVLFAILWNLLSFRYEWLDPSIKKV